MKLNDGTRSTIACVASNAAQRLRCYSSYSEFKAAWLRVPFCIVEVFDDVRDSRWGGFWDRDHHVWAMTEFGEVIDLSISQLHRHPRASRADAIPTPPIWWSDAGVMPPIFRYLPDTVVHALGDPAEAADLDEFKAEVGSEFDRVLEGSEVGDIVFDHVLDCMETLQAMTDTGDTWATKAFVVQRHGLQFPRGLPRGRASSWRVIA